MCNDNPPQPTKWIKALIKALEVSAMWAAAFAVIVASLIVSRDTDRIIKQQAAAVSAQAIAHQQLLAQQANHHQQFLTQQAKLHHEAQLNLAHIGRRNEATLLLEEFYGRGVWSADADQERVQVNIVNMKPKLIRLSLLAGRNIKNSSRTYLTRAFIKDDSLGYFGVPESKDRKALDPFIADFTMAVNSGGLHEIAEEYLDLYEVIVMSRFNTGQLQSYDKQHYADASLAMQRAFREFMVYELLSDPDYRDKHDVQLPFGVASGYSLN
ncbi:MAG: hypothetical protein AAGI37_21255 [Planctomycetota bacterium]